MEGAGNMDTAPQQITTIEEKIDILYATLSNLLFDLVSHGLGSKNDKDTAKPDLLTRLDQKLQTCITTSNFIKENLQKLSKDVGSS